MHVGLLDRPLDPIICFPSHRSPVPLLKFQIAPIIILLTTFGSKKKEPKYVCEWGQGFTLTQNMDWGFLFCSTPLTLGTVVRTHYVCLLRVLCPVSRQVATLDCVLLNDSSLVLAVRLGPKINFWACLRVMTRPHHIAIWCLSIQRFIIFFTQVNL